MKLLKGFSMLAAVAAGVLMAGAARANSIHVTNGLGAGTNSGSTFAYALELTFANTVQTGDFWTLYDFQGLDVSSLAFAPNLSVTTSADWLLTTTPFTPGILVGNQLTEDNGALPNIYLVYTGTTPISATVANVALGTVTATTTMTSFSLVADTYVGQDHTTPGNSIDQNHDNAIVPFSINGPFLPLPASAWGGMALFGVLGGVRLKRRLISVA